MFTPGDTATSQTRVQCVIKTTLEFGCINRNKSLVNMQIIKEIISDDFPPCGAMQWPEQLALEHTAHILPASYHVLLSTADGRPDHDDRMSPHLKCG